MPAQFRQSRGHHDCWTARLATLPDGAPRVPYQDDLLHFTTADGATVTDVDGNEYVDLSNGMGSVFLGHNDPEVTAAVVAALSSRSNALTGPSPVTAEVAGRLLRDIGPGHRTAFFTTGTDAVRGAVNVARRATGRRLVLSAGFHGWGGEWAKSQKAFEPTAAGVVDFYYFLPALRMLLERHRGQVAAVLISPEPLFLSGDWFRTVEALTREAGCLLVADEVKMGYRLQSGPSVGLFGVTADVYVYAKVIANGYRLSVVCGREEVMHAARDLFHTTMFDTLPAEAARATLAKYDRTTAPARIQAECDPFCAALRELFEAHRLPITLEGDGRYFLFSFADEQLATAFYAESTRAGVLFHIGDAQTPSLAFDAAARSRALRGMEQACDQLAHLFPSLLGKPVGTECRLAAAWRVMDGMPEFAASDRDARQQFLRLVAGE